MGIADVYTNVYRLAAMVTRVGRTMYSGILTLILLFTILNMVVRRAIFSSNGFQLVSSFLQIWQLTTVLFQYRRNAFEYVGPTRCRLIPDKDERG